jgi:hypothetical protein
MHDPQDATPPTVPARAAGGQRSWEIDALRGLMLVLMTSTHLPTRFSDPLGQPLGFVSAAEGFVLLSGFVAGRVYTQRRLRSGEDAMREAFVKRAAKLWLCQAGLLVFLLGIVTLIGVLRNQAAITDLVSFFLDRPYTAFVSGLMLLYNPPLLDILPMYVLFMLASPVLLLHGADRGWGPILVASGALWLGAQFGLSEAAYGAIAELTALPVPFRQTGAFELLAWQFLWVLGLWMGASHASGRPAQPTPFPRWAVAFAAAYALVHLVWRHAVGQVPFPDGAALNAAYDKWQLGPLRLLDALMIVLLAMHFGPTLARRLPRLRVLEELGAASLAVFCAHLVLAMLALAFFGAARPDRPWAVDVALLTGSYAILYVVARVTAAVDRRARRAAQRVRDSRDARRWLPTRRPATPWTAGPARGATRSAPATGRTRLD